ncbi:FadR/GntR family transcriptional regulator [Mycetocola tolaasinivorans]|uniref:FadR/GntR family transcriptional regulator n=1 Tax=Mycetocola tolaasinivorans TaxID=76635 RepID=UPI0011C43E32|nr:GntR family transcriptional regulator [Mycetocola tolaasinivorans]
MSIDRIPPLPGRSAPSGTDVLVHLQNLILAGTLEPGERLPSERDLALHLGVSRPLLRESLSRLEARRLVVRRRGSGTSVTADFGREAALIGAVLAASDDHRDAAELRAALDAHILDLAAERMDEAALAALSRAIDDHPEALSADASLTHDEDFHAALARGTGNALIAAISELLSAWARPIRAGAHTDAAARRATMERNQRTLANLRGRVSASADRYPRPSPPS